MEVPALSISPNHKPRLIMEFMFRLTLHFIPSPFGIRWDSPRCLVSSALFNVAAEVLFGSNHGIGHVNIEISDQKRGIHILTGMTLLAQKEDFTAVLQEQKGLGVLFHRFRGRLETPAEIRQHMKKAQGHNRLSFVRFHISATACDRLLTYFDEFKRHEGSYHYGFPCRPRYREGAGCSGFAVSFLEVAGLLHHEMVSAWQNSCRVPHSLIGNGERLVPLHKFFVEKTARAWSHDPGESQELVFWDPDRMHRWTQRMWTSLTQGARTHEIFQPSYDPAPGLVIDASEWPVPDDSIWKHSGPSLR